MKINYFLIVILATLITACGGGKGSSTSDESTKEEIYAKWEHAEKEGLEISFPDEFKKSSFGGNMVIIKKEAVDGFSCNINLMLVPLDGVNYEDGIKEGIKMMDEQVNAKKPSVINTVSINGREWKKTKIEGHMMERDLFWMVYHTKEGDNVYQLTCTFLKAEDQKELESIIGTAKVK